MAIPYRAGEGSPAGYIYPESASNILYCFSHKQCGNQGVEMGVVPLTITPGDPLAKYLLPVLMTLCPAGLEALVRKGGMLPSGDTTMMFY